jgi:GNAT superfamily N-acetyltransferase
VVASNERDANRRPAVPADGRAWLVRSCQEADIEPLARLWFDGWRDAHEAIVPRDLTRLRTLVTFRDRLLAARADTRVVGPSGDPLGFHIVKGDELYQFYVGRLARGSGLAGVLMADAEARLFENGVRTAWLACAIGNERAARFYEKRGWRRAAVFTSELDTPEGPFLLDVWRYEKDLP